VPVASILWAAFCFAFPPLLTLGIFRAKGRSVRDPEFFARWGWGGPSGTVSSSIAAVSNGDWLYVAAFGASGLLGLILWWLSRRNRKRSLKLLGVKARARLAAMLRSMPRPSPRLVPQGAGA
jgi:hypothetical protein